MFWLNIVQVADLVQQSWTIRNVCRGKQVKKWVPNVVLSWTIFPSSGSWRIPKCWEIFWLNRIFVRIVYVHSFGLKNVPYLWSRIMKHPTTFPILDRENPGKSWNCWDLLGIVDNSENSQAVALYSFVVAGFAACCEPQLVARWTQ